MKTIKRFFIALITMCLIGSVFATPVFADELKTEDSQIIQDDIQILSDEVDAYPAVDSPDAVDASNDIDPDINLDEDIVLDVTEDTEEETTVAYENAAADVIQEEAETTQEATTDEASEVSLESHGVSVASGGGGNRHSR